MTLGLTNVIMDEDEMKSYDDVEELGLRNRGQQRREEIKNINQLQ
jgi:hypothetical protein